MKTTNQSISINSGMNRTISQKVNTQKGIDTWFNHQAENFERGRFGWMALLITLQSCLASIACMFILQHKASDIMLMVCAVVAMGCNAILIAQAPGKWCLASFYISVLLNVGFIVVNM